MHVGFFLPNIGQVGNANTLVRVARRAEELGYDSLWVTDRLFYAVKPKTSFYGGPLPEPYKRVLDPVGTLTFVSAQTNHIALGTSVLDIPFYNPVLLARQLTTLDLLSNGRLRVGFGLGWSQDEFDAAGAEMKKRGKRADEFLKVLKIIWTSDPAEFHGKYFQLPQSIIQPKPIQKPHPPIYMAAYAPAAMKRAATFANSWMPVGMPVSALKSASEQITSMARGAGRNPADLKIATRYNLSITPKPLGSDRHIFSGSIDQIREDVEALKDFGPDELVFDVTFSADSQSEEGFLKNLERIHKLI
jgi:probable F420-dependent oxidoreductase